MRQNNHAIGDAVEASTPLTDRVQAAETMLKKLLDDLRETIQQKGRDSEADFIYEPYGPIHKERFVQLECDFNEAEKRLAEVEVRLRRVATALDR